MDALVSNRQKEDSGWTSQPGFEFRPPGCGKPNYMGPLWFCGGWGLSAIIENGRKIRGFTERIYCTYVVIEKERDRYSGDCLSHHPQGAVCVRRWADQGKWYHSVFGVAWSHGWKEYREGVASCHVILSVYSQESLVSSQLSVCSLSLSSPSKR